MAAGFRVPRGLTDCLLRLLPLLIGPGLIAVGGNSQAQTVVSATGTEATGTRVTDTTTTQPTTATTSQYLITGGTGTVGGAVVHSFSKFDLPPGSTAIFDLTSGPSTVREVWARIFSGSPSDLQGTIQVKSFGTSNVGVTLINPFGFLIGSGFNTNGINGLTLLAVPQAFAQISGSTNNYIDLMNPTSSTGLSSALRLAGAAFSSPTELDQSLITYSGTNLALSQFNLLAAKVDFANGSVLKADSLMVVAPWNPFGINFGTSTVASLSSMAFGQYTGRASGYVFNPDSNVLTTTSPADPSLFLVTRDSLYTQSPATVLDAGLAPGSVQFAGSIEPFSAETMNGFVMARQGTIVLQKNGVAYTSPFGDYAVTDLNGTPTINPHDGFSVIIHVDPTVAAYRYPVQTTTNGPGDGATNSPPPNLRSTVSQQFQGPEALVEVLPIPQDLGAGNPPAKPADTLRGSGAAPGSTGQSRTASGAEIAISASSAGVGGAPSFSSPANGPASGMVPTGQPATSSPAMVTTTLAPANATDAFNTSELSITHDTAKSLGVADAQALTPAELQKLLQAATASMRKRSLQAQAGGRTAQTVAQEQASWLASRATAPSSDAPGLGNYFSFATYNPAILSIRFSEAKGRTIDPQSDAFLDYTLIPQQGPIIGQRLELKTARFSALLKQLYATISRQESLDVASSNSASRSLYDLLIGPVADQLRQQKISTLLIAPDRGLQGVPFAALHDGQQFFGDRYAFALTPALSLTDLKAPAGSANRLLTLGASQFNDGLAPLPLVPQELAKIAALDSGEAMLNASFTPRSLIGAAGDPRYGWIHVATHAEFLPGGPSQSRLFTGTQPLPLSAFAELRKTRQDHPIDLFSLSACRTALGDSESELGFAGLAIQAGARSAIGTLWYVDDVATSAYFIQVYRYLKQGLPKAEALQASRRDFSHGRVQLVGNKIVAADGELLLDNLSVPQQRRVASGLANPYFWAGIEMVGSPW